jgi:ABC-type transport system substrate-binding protein
MKKVLSILLAAALVLSLVACGGSTTTAAEDSTAEDTSSTVDLSAYPDSLDEWTSQNFIDYFQSYGLFTDGDGFETWTQDHATYWPGTPVDECVGWWNDDDTVMVMICILSADSADTDEDQLNEWLTSAQEDNTFPGEYATVPVDYVVGHVTFTFESTILDDDVYNAFSEAYQNLVSSVGVG